MSKELLLKAMGGRDVRSSQEAIGPSEVGGCQRKFWMRLKKADKVNQTLRMAAWMGTAIHEQIRREIRYQDPFENRYLTEVEVSDDGLICAMTGHVDVYDKQEHEVIDWKTITKKKVNAFPSEQQRWQVQLYGYLLRENGMQVDNVTLVGIPRDGDERDVVVHSEPYDHATVSMAFQWIDEVFAQDEAPEPEMHPRYCSLYCSYFDAEGVRGCPGKK